MPPVIESPLPLSKRTASSEMVDFPAPGLEIQEILQRDHDEFGLRLTNKLLEYVVRRPK